MNFIAASIELKTHTDRVSAYGLNYLSADAVVAGGNGNNEVRFRLLCFDKEGDKLSSFLAWKPNTRALITGNIVFSNEIGQPLDLIITTLETNVPQDLFCNQVVLGNAFFRDGEYKERDNGTLAVKIGSTLDNSDITTWLFMETHSSRKAKLDDRIRKGRPVCISGYLREYRKDGENSPYRAIVAQDFTTRKEREKAASRGPATGQAAGYSDNDLDPTPDY